MQELMIHLEQVEAAFTGAFLTAGTVSRKRHFLFPNKPALKCKTLVWNSKQSGKVKPSLDHN